MSFFGSLFGTDQADAARNAASDTYGKQRQAINDIQSWGNDTANQYKDLSKAYDPYVQTGYTANNQLQSLLADPSSVRGLPGYQFGLDQGVNALDRSAASRGMVNSGRQQKALLQYGTGYADQTYGNQLQRLMAASGQGMGAVGAQNATVGQGLQDQFGARQSAYQGEMGSAPTIGQGNIAAANAEGAGAMNAVNLGTNLLGRLVGFGGGGGFGGFGGNTGSSFASAGGGNWLNPDYGRPLGQGGIGHA